MMPRSSTTWMSGEDVPEAAAAVTPSATVSAASHLLMAALYAPGDELYDAADPITKIGLRGRVRDAQVARRPEPFTGNRHDTGLAQEPHGEILRGRDAEGAARLDDARERIEGAHRGRAGESADRPERGHDEGAPHGVLLEHA